jgi:hypothetical protein
LTVRNIKGQFEKGNFAETNANWQGGKGKMYARIIAKRCGLLDKGCKLCGIKMKLQVHHIDHNEDNNNISNLEVYCDHHHQSIIHKQDKGKPKTGKFVKCDICRKEIYRRKYRLKSKHQYCSYECSGLSHSKEKFLCV